MMEEESERRCIQTDELEVETFVRKARNRGAIFDVGSRGRRRTRWRRGEEDGNEKRGVSSSLVS
jgi:hypothetical protein